MISSVILRSVATKNLSDRLRQNFDSEKAEFPERFFAALRMTISVMSRSMLSRKVKLTTVSF